MGMQVQMFFDLIPDLTAEEVLDQTLHRLNVSKGDSAHRQKCKDLEEFLNNMLYNKDGQHSEHAQKLRDTVMQYYSEKFHNTISNFDFDQHILQQEGKITLDTYEAYSHKNNIEYDTIRKRIKQAVRHLAKIEDIKEYATIKQETQELIRVANQLRMQYGIPMTGANGQLAVTNSNRDLIKQLDKLYQDVTVFKGIKLTNTEIGELFEKILVVCCQHIDPETEVEDLVKIFAQDTMGKKIVSRNGIISSAMTMSFSNDSADSISSMNNEFHHTFGQAENNELSIEVSGAFEKAQGKMDVDFFFPGDPSDDNSVATEFRVSAKNWGSRRGGKFGETKLRYAIERVVGTPYTTAYGLGLGWPRYKNKTQLHNFAKMSALADIVMGYSQLENYADTIIVNDRAKSAVFVYSIGDLFQRAIENINKIGLRGYSDNLIQKDLYNLFKESDHLGHGFQDKILAQLTEYQLSVGSGLLDLYNN